MTRRSARLVPVLIVTVMGASVATRQFPPGFVDPAPVLAAAAKAIGSDNLRCVTIAGTAYAGAVGQQRESARNVDWPRIEALANYTRTMDWEHATMTEAFDRKPGLNPAAWKYGVRLDRRPAAAAAAPGLHGQGGLRLAHGRSERRSRGVDT